MIKKRFFIKKISDKYLLIPEKGLEIKKCLYTNETGFEIIKFLDKKLSQDEISEKISRKYGVKKEIVKKDVEKFIKDLRERGIIEETEIEE